VVRGRDDLGKDLIIAQDYITDGMRQPTRERATFELGPETDLELRAKLEVEVAAERFTRIDRAMIAEADEGVLDMRPETGRVKANFDRTLRIERLQTLERYGLATQPEPGLWALSERLEAVMRDEVRARAYDTGRARTTSIRVLSGCDLDQQVKSDGATWLDRQLVGRDKSPLVMSRVGIEVREALDRRADELVRQGHAPRTIDGAWRPRTNLIATLQQHEVERAGRELAAQQGLAFAPEGQTVCGKLVGSTQLASGRFAMIDNGLGFSLVPWRPVLENRIGREVMGEIRGEDVSWQFDRGRTPGLGS
jgi:Protein of unknown function (DUF3363)